MDIKDLKAQAYDILAQIDYLRGELSQVNQKIAEMSKQEEKK